MFVAVCGFGFFPSAFSSVLLLSVFCRLSSPVQSTVVSFGQERRESRMEAEKLGLLAESCRECNDSLWRRKSDCVHGETRLCWELLAALKDGSVFH